ncbi:MAG: hypothetical protein ACFFDI_03095 [Promethearchaeota archaeon]
MMKLTTNLLDPSVIREKAFNKLLTDEFIVLEVCLIEGARYSNDWIIMFSDDVKEAMLHAYLILLEKLPPSQTGLRKYFYRDQIIHKDSGLEEVFGELIEMEINEGITLLKLGKYLNNNFIPIDERLGLIMEFFEYNSNNWGSSEFYLKRFSIFKTKNPRKRINQLKNMPCGDLVAKFDIRT